MNFLLKIIEGPMKGAEVALVSGSTVKFGSSDACDIVIADATIGEVAGELEVTGEGVTFITSDGKSDKLTPFEIRDFGTTAIAIGPADGKWQEVVRRKEVEKPSTAPEADKSADDGRAGAPRTPEASSSAGTSEPAAPAPATKRRGRGCAIGCLVVLLILVILGALAWYFWPKITEKYPKAETIRQTTVEKCRTGWTKSAGWVKGLFAKSEKPQTVAPVVPQITLAELASQHNLTLSTPSTSSTSPSPVLSGNLAKRTERLAIRALALAIDPSVKLDLTDDETMKTSANALLFAATDGAIAVKSAKNRGLVLRGYAPSPAALTKALRALNSDVPGIESVDAKEVRVGGQPPAPIAKTEFATIPEPALVDLPTAPAKPQKKSAKTRRDYPIAGILTAPYPCVVMRNGMRLVEGAQVGTATLIKIEADKLTLKEGTTAFEWRP